MKKLTLTIAIVLGMTIGAMAQYSGGLFQRGFVSDEVYYGAESDYYSNLRGGGSLMMPTIPDHGGDGNQDGAPLGSGVAVLLGLGAAYAVAKKRREE